VIARKYVIRPSVESAGEIINPLKPTVAIWVQLCPERQSARMSKITNDCLTRSGTGCFIAVPRVRVFIAVELAPRLLSP